MNIQYLEVLQTSNLRRDGPCQLVIMKIPDIKVELKFFVKCTATCSYKLIIWKLVCLYKAMICRKLIKSESYALFFTCKEIKTNVDNLEELANKLISSVEKNNASHKLSAANYYLSTYKQAWSTVAACKDKSNCSFIKEPYSVMLAFSKDTCRTWTCID